MIGGRDGRGERGDGRLGRRVAAAGPLPVLVNWLTARAPISTVAPCVGAVNRSFDQAVNGRAFGRVSSRGASGGRPSGQLAARVFRLLPATPTATAAAC